MASRALVGGNGCAQHRPPACCYYALCLCRLPQIIYACELILNSLTLPELYVAVPELSRIVRRVGSWLPFTLAQRGISAVLKVSKALSGPAHNQLHAHARLKHWCVIRAALSQPPWPAHRSTATRASKRRPSLWVSRRRRRPARPPGPLQARPRLVRLRRVPSGVRRACGGNLELRGGLATRACSAL